MIFSETISQLIFLEPIPNLTIISTILTQNLESQNLPILSKTASVPYNDFVKNFMYNSSFVLNVNDLHNLNTDNTENILQKIRKINFIYINLFNSFINGKIIFNTRVDRKILYDFFKSENQNALKSSINFSIPILERERRNIELTSVLLKDTKSLKNNMDIIQDFIKTGNLKIDRFLYNNNTINIENTNEIISFIL
jgi:hypothetical protein